MPIKIYWKVNIDRAYYGIVAALPALPRKGQEGFRIRQLAIEFRDLLAEDDFYTLQMAYLPIDHANLILRLSGQKQFFIGGNYDEDDIRRLASGELQTWPHINAFLEELSGSNKMPAPRELSHLLFLHWHKYLLSQPHSRLREWAILHVQLKAHNYLQAPDRLKLTLAPEKEILEDLLSLLGDDAAPGLPDSLVALLRQSDIQQREWDVDEWLWDFLEAQDQFQPFSIDALVSYALQQQLCARRSSLISVKQDHLLDQFVEEAMNQLI